MEMDAVQQPATTSQIPAGAWWQRGVVYEIYPRSFQDADGDGVGDLAGVVERLDYLVELGVDALWLTPIFCSPMVDFGYDISHYTDIDPLFGDLAGFDRLIEEAHRRGLKVILDYVLNHTSDRHPWFEESRASTDNGRRDWYIWRDAAPDGGPPNNWRSEFGGSAWTRDEVTGQYYYHAFLAEQPDLNWRNPDVVRAMLAVLEFWLERGVDGFRVDAIHHLYESESFADNPINPDWEAGTPPAYQLLRVNTVDLPEVHEAIAAIRRLADRYADRVLIGEAYLPIERLVTYYGGALDGFHLPFNFHLISTPWTSQAIANLVSDYEAKLPEGGWPNWVLGNHDRSRVASRIGPTQIRVAATLLLTLRGTPTLYQGDELGLGDVEIPPDQVKDPFEINVPGMGLGRDPVRSPMPWSAAPHAGFSDGEPWLPLGADWRSDNVAAQTADPDSTLSFYRRVLRLRREEPCLHSGAYKRYAVTHSIFAFERSMEGDRLLVILDIGGEGGAIPVPPSEVVLSTSAEPRAGQALEAGVVQIRPNEALVLRIDRGAAQEEPDRPSAISKLD